MRHVDDCAIHQGYDCTCSQDDVAAELEAELSRLRALVAEQGEENAALKKALTELREVLNAGDGIEIYCDVNPEDCDHCVAEQIIDEALGRSKREGPA